MAPPGRGNLLYFPPGVEAGMLADPAVPAASGAAALKKVS